MLDINLSQQANMGGIASNEFGEHYLFAINHNLFQGTDASTVFRSYFGDLLFKEDTFYLVGGTDSGLLYQYVKTQGLPKGSRYLFIELPEVLDLLDLMDGPQDERLAIVTESEWLERAEDMELHKFALLEHLIPIRSLGVVHGHYSDYPRFWRQFKTGYDSYLKNLRQSLSSRPFILSQIENLTENEIPANCLRDSFIGKTAVLLAGGPSLDELLPWVKQNRQNLLVVAVSRISRSLIQAGIQPDISVSVDPQATNLNVCKDMLQFADGTLLANNYHLSPNLLSSWEGKKVFIGPRYPWPTSLQPENIPPAGGTTVTNTAFDLAVKTGVSQLILGGVDFCFGQDGHTHASGTDEHAMGPMPNRFEQQVETNCGMMADCANGYREAGENIDLQAKEAVANGCKVINPAPWAMRLQNVEHISLSDIQFEPMVQTAREVIASIVPQSDTETRIILYKEELAEIERVLKELASIRELSSKALNINSKLISNSGRYNAKTIDHAKAAKVDRIDEQMDKKYADTIAFIKRYDQYKFIPLLGLNIENMEELVENSQVYFQAIIDTSKELIKVLRTARVRIMSRLEEEKPAPNVQNLLQQWIHDKQPGRAINWTHRHENYIDQLPPTQRQALDDFQASFDDVVEKLGEDYISQITMQGLELHGIAGRAKEYFSCQDKDGLERLLKSLEIHQDREKAEYYIPLLHGYIAELNADSALAINAYQNISCGSAQIDSLMRLFGLHTKAEDYDSAVEDLKTLSSITQIFKPMYAEMLQAMGDVDSAVGIYTDHVLANPEDLNTMMKLGKLFMECGAADGVEWTMSYILGKDPENHTAQKILQDARSQQQTESSLE